MQGFDVQTYIMMCFLTPCQQVSSKNELFSAYFSNLLQLGKNWTSTPKQVSLYNSHFLVHPTPQWCHPIILLLAYFGVHRNFSLSGSHLTKKYSSCLQELIICISQTKKIIDRFIMSLFIRSGVQETRASLMAQLVKNLLKCRRTRFDPWIRKIPWKRELLPTLVFLPGEFHRQRSLVGYSPWGRKESDMTERLTLSGDYKEM